MITLINTLWVIALIAFIYYVVWAYRQPLPDEEPTTRVNPILDALWYIMTRVWLICLAIALAIVAVIGVYNTIMVYGIGMLVLVGIFAAG